MKTCRPYQAVHVAGVAFLCITYRDCLFQGQMCDAYDRDTETWSVAYIAASCAIVSSADRRDSECCQWKSHRLVAASSDSMYQV